MSGLQRDSVCHCALYFCTYFADSFMSWAKYEKDWERFEKHNPDQTLTIYYEDLKEVNGYFFIHDHFSAICFAGFCHGMHMLATVKEGPIYSSLK